MLNSLPLCFFSSCKYCVIDSKHNPYLKLCFVLSEELQQQTTSQNEELENEVDELQCKNLSSFSFTTPTVLDIP